MKIPEEIKAKVVRAVAENAWRNMTRDMPLAKPFAEQPSSMQTPMIQQTEATLAPVWPIIESEIPT